MKKATERNILLAILFLFCLAFVIIFGKPVLLKMYVESGIGWKKIPIFYLAPEKEIINPALDTEYLSGLTLQKFRTIQINAPKDFKVISETIAKVYYKKQRRNDRGAVFYLLYKGPNFFIGLFPEMKKQGIVNDYDFINRIMSAKINEIRNRTDTFFAIMKGIWTPSLGDQKNIKMIKFSLPDKKGFINYNLADIENYFDCNIIDSSGNFFKVYIKDKAKKLDLAKVLTILSTVKKPD